jgi:hypothetical protein
MHHRQSVLRCPVLAMAEKIIDWNVFFPIYSMYYFLGFFARKLICIAYYIDDFEKEKLRQVKFKT